MRDFKALGAKAAAEGADQTKTTTGGGDFDPPAAGPCRLRFIAYIEVGKQAGTYMGKPKVSEKVLLTFELSGPKHPPIVMPDGSKMPHRITLEENLSLNEKARFAKLFARMNYAGGAQHMVQLLSNPEEGPALGAYKATVIHRKYAKRGEPKDDTSKWTGVAVELYDKKNGTYTIEPPRYEKVNPEEHEQPGPTGEYLPLKVDQAITPSKGFLWQYADKESWDSLFIEGEYPERKDDKGVVTAPAKSKNVFQNWIKRAANFKGSPIYAVIAEAGGNLDIPDAEQGMDDEPGDDAIDAETKAAIQKAAAVPTGVAADDALNGVVA